MNKGIKETKSDTKRNKNVSKIATRIISSAALISQLVTDNADYDDTRIFEIFSEKKRSPTRGKDRSSSMNSLVLCEGAEPRKKNFQKEAKSKKVSEISIEKIRDSQKSVDFSSSPSEDQGKRQSSETSTLKTTEEIEIPRNRKSKLNQKEKFFYELIAREGSIEKLLEIKKNAKTVYNVDGMSPAQIKESLARVDDNIAKPFSFLKDIIDNPEENKPKINPDAKDQELNPTDIDLQLSSLVRRVELNRTLLERANQRVKDISFLAERNRMISIRDLSYDEESFFKIKKAGVTSKESVSATDLTAASHPAVEELQKTMSSTIEMLGYVHKMSSGDLASGEIPAELTNYLSTPITTRENV